MPESEALDFHRRVWMTPYLTLPRLKCWIWRLALKVVAKIATQEIFRTKFNISCLLFRLSQIGACLRAPSIEAVFGTLTFSRPDSDLLARAILSTPCTVSFPLPSPFPDVQELRQKLPALINTRVELGLLPIPGDDLGVSAAQVLAEQTLLRYSPASIPHPALPGWFLVTFSLLPDEFAEEKAMERKFMDLLTQMVLALCLLDAYPKVRVLSLGAALS